MVVKTAFLYTTFMRGVETVFCCTLRSLKIEYQHFSTSSTDGEYGSPAGIPCAMIPCTAMLCLLPNSKRASGKTCVIQQSSTSSVWQGKSGKGTSVKHSSGFVTWEAWHLCGWKGSSSGWRCSFWRRGQEKSCQRISVTSGIPEESAAAESCREITWTGWCKQNDTGLFCFDGAVPLFKLEVS